MSAGLALLAAIASWAILLVASRVLILAFQLDPWSFAFLQMAAGGLFMMWVGRRTVRVRETLGSPLTWLYGVLRVGTAGFFTAALVHTSAANAAFLSILSVPLAVVATVFLFARRPARSELPGHALVLVGVVSLGNALEAGLANPAVVLMLMSTFCVVGATIVAEVHPVNKGEDERSRVFLTGAVLLVSALGLIVVLVLGQIAFRSFAPGDDVLATRGLADPLLWLCACAVGALARGPSVYLSLKAIARAGAVTYVAAMAALPLIAFVLERLVAVTGLGGPEAFQARLLAYGVLASLGSLLVVLARSRRSPA